MQRPGTFPPIEFVPGDHVTFTMTLVNDDATPIDLTGCSVAAQVRVISGADDEPLLASFTVLNTLDDSGEIRLRLTSANTLDLSGKKNLAWDCQITFPGGTIRTVVSGLVRPLKNTTQL